MLWRPSSLSYSAFFSDFFLYLWNIQIQKRSYSFMDKIVSISFTFGDSSYQLHLFPSLLAHYFNLLLLILKWKYLVLMSQCSNQLALTFCFRIRLSLLQIIFSLLSNFIRFSLVSSPKSLSSSNLSNSLICLTIISFFLCLQSQRLLYFTSFSVFFLITTIGSSFSLYVDHLSFIMPLNLTTLFQALWYLNGFGPQSIDVIFNIKAQ